MLCDPSAGAQAASKMALLPVLADGLFCFAMDISSTGQALLIADSTGTACRLLCEIVYCKVLSVGVVHLWSSNEQPLFNSYSRPTIFPDPIVPLPYIDFDDMSVPLSIIPMPVSGYAVLLRSVYVYECTYVCVSVCLLVWLVGCLTVSLVICMYVSLQAYMCFVLSV